MSPIVLVHGAWHGRWCWERVAGPLRDLGHDVVVTELHRGSLEADTAAVQDDVDALAGRGPVVVCGHSYGGAVVTGLRPTGICHLVCIAGFLLDAGESCMRAGTISVPATDLGRAMKRVEDGITAIDPTRAADAFYGDCTPADQAWAIERLQPQAMTALAGVPARQLWRDVPTTYAVCTDDRAVHPLLQHHLAERAGTVVEWPTSHSPFVSRPDLVIGLLSSVLGA